MDPKSRFHNKRGLCIPELVCIFPLSIGACRVLWVECQGDTLLLCKINPPESETFGWRFSRRENLARGLSSQIIWTSRRRGWDQENSLIRKPQVTLCNDLQKHDLSDLAIENLFEKYMFNACRGCFFFLHFYKQFFFNTHVRQFVSKPAAAQLTCMQRSVCWYQVCECVVYEELLSSMVSFKVISRNKMFSWLYAFVHI